MLFKRFLILSASLFLLIAIFSCDEDSNPTNPILEDTTAVVMGVVTDSASGFFLSEAHVLSDDGDSAITDNDGKYVLELGIGEKILTASAANYIPVEKPATTHKTDTVTVNFSLTLELQDPEPGSISGTVTNPENDEPIESVTIAWTDGQTLTDSDGNYSIELEAGTYTLSFSAEGYEPGEELVELAEGEAKTLNITLIPEAPDLPGIIVGVVSHGNNVPIEEARVLCDGVEDYTDEIGSYRLEVSSGPKQVFASKRDFETERFDILVESGNEHTLNIELTGNADGDGRITGRVADTEGNPISGASVSFDGVIFTTSGSGIFAGEMTVGRYTVIASKAGFDNSAPRSVNVIPGENAPINISLTPSGGGGEDVGGIIGTVTNRTTGAAIQGATVSCAGRSTQTNAQGQYNLTNVREGVQMASATAPGYSGANISVTVIADQNITQNFQLTPGGGGGGNGTIKGRVTDASNGRVINLAEVSCSGITVWTDVSGDYALREVPSGPQTVSVTTDGYLPASQNVNVIANGTISNVNFALQPGGGGEGVARVRGRVVDSNGSGINGATVRADTGQSVRTDANGSYSNLEVPSGNRTFRASAPGYSSATDSRYVAANSTPTINFTLR